MREVLEEQILEMAASETDYLLTRWQFTVTERGFLWASPLGPTLRPEELAGFLALLRRACDAAFPSVILFDLGDVQIVGQEWTPLLAVLSDFAVAINARCRLVAGHDRPVSAVYLYRHGHV